MIKHRKWGHERFAAGSAATHLVKIGFNNGKVDERTKRIEQAFFGRLRGFVVFRNQTQANGTHPPDMAMMMRLIAEQVRRDTQAARVWRETMAKVGVAVDEANPVTAAGVQAALDFAFAKQTEAPDGLLPNRLEFVLAANASRNEEGNWTFPGIYDDAFVAMKTGGCLGEFCRGDGATASRWQPDGTRRKIACVPMGKDGTEAADWCEFSMPSERNGKLQPPACNAIGTLSVVLAVREEDGRMVPLSKLADARFEFETRSGACQRNIGRQLQDAADRLNGQIAGLCGTLSFAMRNRLAPAHAGGKIAALPQVDFFLNEFEIQLREREMRGGRALGAAPAMVMLPPPQPAEVRLLEAEPEDFEGFHDDAPLLDDRQGPTEIEPREIMTGEEEPTEEERLREANRALGAELVRLAERRASLVGPGSKAESWIEFWTRSEGRSGVRSVEVLFQFERTNPARHAAGMKLLAAAVELARAQVARAESKEAASA